MNSSYKPKLLEIFLNEKDDSMPELVEIRNIPQRDEEELEGRGNRRGMKQTTNSDLKLDLSGYKHDSVNRSKGYQAQYDEEGERQKATRRLTNQIAELETRVKDERRKVLLYEQKVETLQGMVNKANFRVKEYQGRISDLEQQNDHLNECKDGLEKQIRELRLIESSQYTSYSKAQPAQYKKEIFEKLEIYLKRLIENFIEGLKPERINKQVEEKIEVFLSELLQINSQSIENSTKGRYPPLALHKYSYTESPIADQSSYIDTKHKLEYSPFNQSRKEEEPFYLSGQQRGKRTEREREEPQKSPNRLGNTSYDLPRFNFIRESVGPSINDQSAFMSISQGMRSSVEKSYERNDRSRSQRRKKIFS